LNSDQNLIRPQTTVQS